MNSLPSTSSTSSVPSLQRYPLPFPEYESMYIFDTGTGYFWSSTCGYYFDATSKLYFDPLTQLYLKRTTGSTNQGINNHTKNTVPTFEIWNPPPTASVVSLQQQNPTETTVTTTLLSSLVSGSGSSRDKRTSVAPVSKPRSFSSPIIPELPPGIITVCVPCSRGFRSEATLKRHENESVLHQQNVSLLHSSK